MSCMSILHSNRTSRFCIMYSLYLYFLGLSFRSTSKALEPFEERSHVPVWKWVQRFRLNRIYVRKRVDAFVIDESMILIDNDVTMALDRHRTYQQNYSGCIHFKRQNHAYSRSIPENLC